MLLRIIKISHAYQKGGKGTDIELLVKTIYPFLSLIYLILVKTIIQSSLLLPTLPSLQTFQTGPQP